MKFYGYSGCSTCRNAKKFLRQHNVAFDDVEITENPPEVRELQAALKTVPLKQLLNTSGEAYRALNLKDTLPGMQEKEVVQLLHTHGKLVKRPFVIDGDKITVGFKEEVYKKIWL